MKLDPSLHFKKSQSVWKKPFGLKVCLSLSEKPLSLHVYQSVTNSLQIAAIKKNMFFDLFFFQLFQVCSRFFNFFFLSFFELFHLFLRYFRVFQVFFSQFSTSVELEPRKQLVGSKKFLCPYLSQILAENF